MLDRKVNMRNFLSKQDMVFDDLPHQWDEAPFLGNGRFGTLLFHNEKNELLIKLGHTDIYDNRIADEHHVHDKLFLSPRLPVGDFILKTKEPVQSGNARLILYDAVIKGTLETNAGSIQYQTYISVQKDVMVFEWTCSGNEKAEITFLAAYAQSPRQTKMKEIHDTGRLCKSYETPKDAVSQDISGIHIHTQPYASHGGFSISWKIVTDGKKHTLYASVAQDTNHDETARSNALTLITDALNNKNLFNNHKAYWHKIYGQSFISLSDHKFENFYWIQVYKINSATYSGGKIIDTTGPWLTTTSWPGAFWNLNVQITYEPMYPSNQLSAAESLWKTLEKELNTLIQNVDEPYRGDCAGIGTNTTSSLHSPVAVPNRDTEGYVELGNLTWALHCCYLHYRMTMDTHILNNIVYPLLKRAIKYYSYFLSPDKNGILHLAPTSSPEYLVVDKDCNYDLSLIRWGCRTLSDICSKYQIADPDQKLWENILKNLAPYPENENEGFQITANVPMHKSHRHYSHLLMIYPLHLLNPHDKKDREKMIRSLRHWHSMPNELEGYSQTGAASMFAMLGDGNSALMHLDKLWKGFIRPNTMYKEDGGPVLETPLAAMNAILDMLIQSYDGIHIFPAVPDIWNDITFENLCAEGAFRVSASMKHHQLQWVHIKSLKGETCIVHADFHTPAHIEGCKYERLDKNTYALYLPQNEEAVLYVCKPEEICVSSVPTDEASENCYGLNERMDKILTRISVLDKKK